MEAQQTDISPNELFTGPGRYALKVKGDSMTKIGVLDGDYVVVQRADTADEGDVVVALIDREEATLKRISYKEEGVIALIPENDDMEPMYYPPHRVQIQGRMVGIFRTYQ